MKKIAVVLAFVAISGKCFGQVAPTQLAQKESQFYVPFSDKFIVSLNAKSDSIMKIVMESDMKAKDAQKIVNYVSSIKSLFAVYRRIELADTTKKKGKGKQ
jgi:hypothetical protein